MKLFNLSNVVLSFIEFCCIVFRLFLSFVDDFVIFLELMLELFLFFFEFKYSH